MHAAPRGTPIDDEVKRLSSLASNAVPQRPGAGPADPLRDVDRRPSGRRRVVPGRPGIGAHAGPQPLPSGPEPRRRFRLRFPYVQNVQLRDTGTGPGEFQVRVGQGKIDYARIVNMLQRHGYNRALTVTIIDRLENPFDREVEVRKLKLLLETLI